MSANNNNNRRKVLKKIGGLGASSILLGGTSLPVSAASSGWNSEHNDEYYYDADNQYVTTLFNLQYHGSRFDEDSVNGEHWRHEFSVASQLYSVEWNEEYIDKSEVPNAVHEYWHGDNTDDPDYPRDKVKNGLEQSYYWAQDYKFKANITDSAYSIDDNKSEPYYHLWTLFESNGSANNSLVDRTFDATTVAVGLRYPYMGAALAVTGLVNEATTEYDKNLNGDGVIGLERHGGSNGFGPMAHSQWFTVKTPPDTSANVFVTGDINLNITAGKEMLARVNWDVNLFAASKPNDDEWHDIAAINNVGKSYDG